MAKTTRIHGVDARYQGQLEAALLWADFVAFRDQLRREFGRSASEASNEAVNVWFRSGKPKNPGEKYFIELRNCAAREAEKRRLAEEAEQEERFRAEEAARNEERESRKRQQQAREAVRKAAVSSASCEEETGLPLAPKELAGRTASEPEVVRWVVRNIDNPEADAKDCPDPFAWTLLRECRVNDSFRFMFIRDIWTKVLAAEVRMSDDGGDDRLDGTPTLELIDRIRLIRNESESRTRDAVA